MAEVIALDFDAARQHAGRVVRVADRVETARGAAASMDLGGGAFGLMCAFLVPPAVAITGAAERAVASAGALVERSARELRGMVEDFESREEQIAADVRGIETAVEGVR